MEESEGTGERLSLNFSNSLFLFRIFKRCLREDEEWPPVCKIGQPALRWVSLPWVLSFLNVSSPMLSVWHTCLPVCHFELT